MLINSATIEASTERSYTQDPIPRLGNKTINAHCEAFSEIYERFYQRVYRYILLRVNDEISAEDLAAQVFLKAWERIDHYQLTDAEIVPWLFTIAHNTIIDYYRTHKETIQLEMTGALPSEGMTPEEESESLYEMECLQGAIEELTAEQQHVVIMKYLKGLSTEEIAVQMGKRTGTVRALQMRALQSLSQKLLAVDS